MTPTRLALIEAGGMTRSRPAIDRFLEKVEPLTREGWLMLAVERIRKAVLPELPAVAVSVGFPSKRGVSPMRRVIGQCWAGATTADKVPAIFVSPVVKNAKEALGVLIHEACHAITPKDGHGPAFQKTCRRVGLAKGSSWTSAGPGPDLAKRLNALMPEPFGHAAITVVGMTRVQSTRLLKAECPNDGYTVRVTRKWLDQLGAPVCPCGEPLGTP